MLSIGEVTSLLLLIEGDRGSLDGRRFTVLPDTLPEDGCKIHRINIAFDSGDCADFWTHTGFPQVQYLGRNQSLLATLFFS